MSSESTPQSDLPRFRIGMLTPSSNTVVEPLTSQMLEPMKLQASAHFSRFRVTQISLDASSDNQFALRPILEAASLLADAKCDVIAWNGTSASWLGFDTDETLCAAITKETGIRATSAILSLNALLVELGVKRLGLVTPYTEDVQNRIIANYRSVGVDTVAQAHCGLSDNFSFAEVTERQIEDMVRQVATERPDAIAIVCTNMRGPMVAARLEKELGIPILDSVAFTLQGCLQSLGQSSEPLGQFGTMFQIAASPPLAVV